MFRKIIRNFYSVIGRKLTIRPISQKAHILPDYLLGPGMHLPSSPVVASRSQEFSKVSYSVMNNPLLNELGKKIYDINYRLIIPEQKRVKANRVAQEIFLNYIKKYASYGITESNIVAWNINKSTDSKLSGRCSCLNLAGTRYLNISVEADNGVNYKDKGYFTPAHIVAYHEVMHAEEYKKNLFLYAYGREMMTTLKSIILLDEVYKKTHQIDLNIDINYKKSITINHKKIPLGTFANFYRSLEKKHGNLGEAIPSTQSLKFLETGSAPMGIVP